MVRAVRQSNKQDRRANVKRMESVAPARFRFPLDKQSELLTQKQIFGSDGGRVPETEIDKGQCIEKDVEDIPNHLQKRLHDSILLKLLKSARLRNERNICGPQRIM
jgi:hypothetical protein